MNTSKQNQRVFEKAHASPEVLRLARTGVRELLSQNASFRALPADLRQQIASDTVDLVSYLAEPEGIKGTKISALQQKDIQPKQPKAQQDAYAFAQDTTTDGSARSDDPGKFTAQSAAEGARVAKAYLQGVNFPDFVAGLIKGVFHSIVQASIEQMHAYGQLVSDVAKTLNQFRDDNVTDNQGRDYLVQQFPDTFQLKMDQGGDGSTTPRVSLRDGADETQALQKVNNLPIEGGPLTGLDDDSVEQKLVPAARTQLATSRQQLLATMVLMGINRILVTDGRIAAKVLFDFQAQDNFKFQRSAVQYDYGKQYKYASSSQTGTSDGTDGSQDSSSDSGQTRDGSYYATGAYQYSAEPVLTLQSASQGNTDATLQTHAQLSGSVEVNFKSEAFPLEKMADSFQIGRIQDAAKPKSSAAVGGPPSATTPPPTPPSTTTQPAAAHA